MNWITRMAGQSWPLNQPEKGRDTMKKIIICITLYLTLFASIAYANCGALPPQPVTPVGCTGAMVAYCQCDSMGQNCRWVWVCQ